MQPHDHLAAGGVGQQGRGFIYPSQGAAAWRDEQTDSAGLVDQGAFACGVDVAVDVGQAKVSGYG